MRRIGSLEQAAAERFTDYLITRSIDASTSEGDDGLWDVWIRDERDVDDAKQAFESFSSNPNDAQYEVRSQAEQIRKEKEAELKRRRAQQEKLVQSAPTRSYGPGLGVGAKQQSIPITIGIIAISVICSFTTNFGEARNRTQLQQTVYQKLSFVDVTEFLVAGDPYASLRKGEVWRLVTPMFMHVNPLHLLFNMIWVFMLGSLLERLHGSLFFLILTLGTQIAGMALQVGTTGMDFLPEPLQGSPFAIGASGAVYGLFGFIWIRPFAKPEYPVRLSSSNVVIMIGWLFLCMTMGSVANGAHIGGLLAGMAVARSLPRKI